MVCIPCIVIPVFLWVFHRFIQPYILKFWNPWKKTLPDSEEEKPLLSDDDVKSDEYVFIQQQLKANPVVVFSKTTCGYCSMVEDVFSRIKLSYNHINIDERPDCDKLQELFGKMTGAKTVPRVFVGGKCIGGGTDTYTLHNEGKLLPLLEKAGAHFYKKDD